MVRGVTFLIKEENGVLICTFVFTYAKSRFSDHDEHGSFYNHGIAILCTFALNCVVFFICFYRLTGVSVFTITLIFVLSLSTIRTCPSSITLLIIIMDNQEINVIPGSENGRQQFQQTQIRKPILSKSTKIAYKVKVIEKQWTGTGAIKRQIPLLKQKREINKYYK